jgi:hypothetical protein
MQSARCRSDVSGQISMIFCPGMEMMRCAVGEPAARLEVD